MEWASTPGLTSASSTDSGPIIRCTAMALSPGEMAEFIRVITSLIRKKVMAFTPWLMAAATGNWKDGKQHGTGIFITQTGVEKSGDWRYGKRSRVENKVKDDC